MQNRVTGVNVHLIPTATTTTTTTTLVFVDRISIICPIIFTFADRIHDLISRSFSLFQSAPKEKALSQISTTQSEVIITQQKDCSMSREEVKFVMEKLELFCSKEGDEEEIGESFGTHELTAIFDENEPSLEELKQTFDVFDRNRDGFIDAQELHTLLGLLGSNKGIFIHDCHRMIARFDHNKDGKIDFNEFVKFMEIALS